MKKKPSSYQHSLHKSTNIWNKKSNPLIKVCNIPKIRVRIYVIDTHQITKLILKSKDLHIIS